MLKLHAEHFSCGKMPHLGRVSALRAALWLLSITASRFAACGPVTESLSLPDSVLL